MNNEEYYLADAIDVIDEVLASGGEFCIYPKGTSMLPLIVQTRDSVVLRRSEGVPAKKHDIAFYRRDDGHFVLHRVVKICDDGTYTMCGDNQTLLEKGIRPEQIIAYVCGVNRKGKKIKMDGFGYRTYVFFWTKRPLRRVLILGRTVLSKIGKMTRKILPKRS